MTNYKFDSIKDAINDIANGKMVIVVDDEDRENEGDLVLAAHFATAENINFMIKHGKGLVCVPVTDEIIERMSLTDMVKDNKDTFKTAFTTTIDATTKHGVTTGISAQDRAQTIQVFINPKSTVEDVNIPGHIFPLRAKKMGVLRRAGHTEAAVDLARLAGFQSAGVICEIIKDDGEMARLDDLIVFAQKYNLKLITIQSLIQYRLKNESFVEKGETAKLPTEFGDFNITTFKDTINNKTHIALVKGTLDILNPVLVRVHSECLTGDIFHSLRCDCQSQLSKSLKMIEENGSGILLYMKQEGRGIGIENKIKAYKLQEEGKDTVEANNELGFSADLRDYGVGAQILIALGVNKINLITNNPRKVVGLKGYGLEIVDRVPIISKSNKHNEKYLKTKSKKLGHMYD